MDHKDFKPVGQKWDEPKERTHWWCEAEYDAHGAVFALAKAIADEQQDRRAANADHARLYGDRDLPTLLGSASSPRAAALRGPSDKLTYNLVKVAIDTLRAKISKQKPKASFATDGGSWSQQRRAKRLERFVFGVMQQVGAYVKGRDIFRDGCVCDMGAAKLFLERDAKGKPSGICMERVEPSSLRVGVVDGMHGEPRTLVQTQQVSREVLKALAPAMSERKLSSSEEAALLKAIDEAKPPDMSERALMALGDMVEVQEAWHLPSAKGAKDGRHVICVSGATLLDEPWTRDCFPFEFFRFDKRLAGFEGQGVAEQLVTRQRTINKKLRSINDALRLMSVPRYFVKSGSQFSVEQLTNEPGTIMRGLEAPQVMTGNVVPPELFQSVQADIREGLEMVGVSQLSASARKPAGLDSGAALREYNDIESERFILVGQAYEEFFVGVARHIIALAREAAEEGSPLEVPAEARGGLQRISWDKVAMDEREFVLKAFPTSSLPTTPAARKKAVRELWEDGLIDGLEYRRLLDMPDMDASNNVAFAAQEDIEAEIERLLDSGEDDEVPEYRPPEPYQDLKYGLKRFQSAYLRARNMGAPEGRLELLRRWMEQARAMDADAAAAGTPAAGPAALPAGPGGQPALPAGAPPLAA